MTLHTRRPFYLNLFKIWLPFGGVVSILHRVSGVILSLAIPLVIWLWALSLRSAGDFATLQALTGGVFGALAVAGLIWAVLHHLFAGIRHLGFDIGWGEEKTAARRSAWLAFVAAILLTLILWGLR